MGSVDALLTSRSATNIDRYKICKSVETLSTVASYLGVSDTFTLEKEERKWGLKAITWAPFSSFCYRQVESLQDHDDGDVWGLLVRKRSLPKRVSPATVGHQLKLSCLATWLWINTWFERIHRKSRYRDSTRSNCNWRRCESQSNIGFLCSCCWIYVSDRNSRAVSTSTSSEMLQSSYVQG